MSIQIPTTRKQNKIFLMKKTKRQEDCIHENRQQNKSQDSMEDWELEMFLGNDNDLRCKDYLAAKETKKLEVNELSKEVNSTIPYCFGEDELRADGVGGWGPTVLAQDEVFGKDSESSGLKPNLSQEANSLLEHPANLETDKQSLSRDVLAEKENTLLSGDSKGVKELDLTTETNILADPFNLRPIINRVNP